MSESSLKLFLNHPSQAQIAESLVIFERTLPSGKIHFTARHGLLGNDKLAFARPFPKIESHEDYIYGVFATPTDVQDGASDFFSIQLVMHHQMSLVVLRGPGNHGTKRSSELFSQLQTSVDGEPQDSGDIFVQIAHVVIQDLQMLVSGLHEAVSREMSLIESQLFDDEYQSMSRTTSDTYRRIRSLKFEILSIGPTIEETQNVFKAVLDQKVMIRPQIMPTNNEIMPFSATQRMWVDDLLMQTRSLKAQRKILEQEVHLLYERLETLENRRQTAAQMRFAAVASILLLPALIVGFFGQNFRVASWADSDWSWEISAAILALLAILQYIYFKKKKWF